MIVSQSNIYVVELKHWSGKIQVAGYSWLINKQTYRPDPHLSNNFKCKVLKGVYQHEFTTYPNVWIESVVVLTHPKAVVEGADSPKEAADRCKRNPTFASVSDLISYINRRSSKEENRVLQTNQVDAISQYLQSLNQTKPSEMDRIMGYEIVEQLSVTPERLELLGRDADGQIKGLKRLRVFRVPPELTEEEKARYVNKINNEMKSISRIDDHPNILHVQFLKNYNSDVIEVSDWSETGTLRDFIDMQDEKLAPKKALTICKGILSALTKAHEVDVIHRAVKPENILLVNDRPKLMNFDLAYIVEDNRLTVIEDPSSLQDDGYTAPEILLKMILMKVQISLAWPLLLSSCLQVNVRSLQCGSLSTKEAFYQQKHASLKILECPVSLSILLPHQGLPITKRLKDLNLILEAFYMSAESGGCC